MTRQLKLTITMTFDIDDAESEDSTCGFAEIIEEWGENWQAECIDKIYWNKDWALALDYATWQVEIIEQETAA